MGIARENTEGKKKQKRRGMLERKNRI